jgi:hypothetical protein
MVGLGYSKTNQRVKKTSNCIVACGASFLTSLKSQRLLSNIFRNRLFYAKFVIFVYHLRQAC